MVSFLRVLCLTFFVNSMAEDCQVKRKKRWLVFPKGSSLQLVYCFLVSDLWTRDGIFVVGITVGLAWEIPQNLRQIILTEGVQQVHARQRRQLYSKLSLLLDKQGLEGESCILRAVCEAKRMDTSRKMSFLTTLLHSFFTEDQNFVGLSWARGVMQGNERQLGVRVKKQ